MSIKFEGKMQPKKAQLPVAKNYTEHLVESQPITALTTIEHKYGKTAPWTGGVAEEETVHPGMLANAKIAVEGGRTLSLGNFEFARIGVTLTVPYDFEKKDMDKTMGNLIEAYDFATDFISKKIDEATKIAKGG